MVATEASIAAARASRFRCQGLMVIFRCMCLQAE